MNKILLDKELFVLDNNSYKIDVTNNSKIYINNISDVDLEINMLDNSSLDIYLFNTKNTNNKILVNQSNNTTINLYHSFKIDGNYNFDYNSILNGNNNINNVFISGVSNGYANMSVDGNAIKGTKNNELNENIKVLTINGKAHIMPMLHVSVLDVIANHNTTISNISKKYLDYLMSKGINKEKSVELIENGYLYGLYKNEEEFLKLIR